MPNDDLFTNDVMLFRLNESYWMRTIVLCSCIVVFIIEPQDLFDFVCHLCVLE